MYTIDQNPYRSAAFCLLPDDDEREIAYPKKTEALTALCEENGWRTVSMKNDFKTIYKEGVKKDPDNHVWLDNMLSLCD